MDILSNSERQACIYGSAVLKKRVILVQYVIGVAAIYAVLMIL